MYRDKRYVYHVLRGHYPACGIYDLQVSYARASFARLPKIIDIFFEVAIAFLTLRMQISSDLSLSSFGLQTFNATATTAEMSSLRDRAV